MARPKHLNILAQLHESRPLNLLASPGSKISELSALLMSLSHFWTFASAWGEGVSSGRRAYVDAQYTELRAPPCFVVWARATP